jgi:prolyl-tRNA synthetase
MRQSKLFTKTIKDAPKDEVSLNAQLLIRAGFIHKEMAGVYSYLPLGLIVIEKIKDIIREELNAVGSVEMIMTALQSSDIWEKTNRWSDEVVDNWFRTNLKSGKELGLAFTHEEPIANIMSNYVSSYKDLPFYAYQFQTKFRNELRAKAGILRGREFLMKDLYSFSTTKEQHDEFYEKMKTVYLRIFERMGLGEQTYLTMSSGEPFAKYSFEFQTLCEAGEDTILYDEAKRVAINKDDYSDEIFTDFGFNKEDFNFKEGKSIEIGDIYSLGEKYSEALGLGYTDNDGKKKNVYMGSYGIGVPRVMGTIVEVHNDENGIVWPAEVAPFQVHLIYLGRDSKIQESADQLYKDLTEAGVEILYDDRDESAGTKFKDSDLMGMPVRIVISDKTMANNQVEYKLRKGGDAVLVDLDKIAQKLKEK